MSNTDWVKFAGMRIIQICGVSILTVLLIIAGVGLFTKKPIKMWGLEFNIKEIVHDTVPPRTHDTVIKIVTVKSPAPRNSQKNDNGGSGVQNNGTNNGQQAGRDINNTYVKDKELTEGELESALKDIEKEVKSKGLGKCFAMTLSTGSNGSKVYSQLKELLVNAGYNFEADMNSLSPSKGITYGRYGGCLNIIVGTF